MAKRGAKSQSTLAQPKKQAFESIKSKLMNGLEL
jgi:hypothetical protein